MANEYLPSVLVRDLLVWVSEVGVEAGCLSRLLASYLH